MAAFKNTHLPQSVCSLVSDLMTMLPQRINIPQGLAHTIKLYSLKNHKKTSVKLVDSYFGRHLEDKDFSWRRRKTPLVTNEHFVKNAQSCTIPSLHTCTRKNISTTCKGRFRKGSRMLVKATSLWLQLFFTQILLIYLKKSELIKIKSTWGNNILI